jgi:anti-sigma B factor antagonist
MSHGGFSCQPLARSSDWRLNRAGAIGPIILLINFPLLSGRIDMNISQRTVQGVCVLDIDGPITLGADGSERLGDKVRSVLQAGEKQLLLNLGGVAYIDSAGLGELVNAFTTVKKQGGALKLFGVTKKLQDLLVITKLSTVFDSYDTEEAAIKSFGATA